MAEVAKHLCKHELGSVKDPRAPQEPREDGMQPSEPCGHSQLVYDGWGYSPVGECAAGPSTLIL